MITVIGCAGGPLDEEARRRLAAARLVVGARRHLQAVPLPVGVPVVELGPLEPALDRLAGHDGDVVLLASGDPGFFGIVRALAQRDLPIEVRPAVSAVATVFARLGLPWEDAVVVSAHGRDARAAVNACRAHPKVALLTGPSCPPERLGAELAGLGRTLVVAEDLGGEERLTSGSAEEVAARRWREPNVVVVLERRRQVARPGWLAGGRPPAGPWALADDTFDHRDSMITKAEVRALALARLGPGVGDLVWDVGAGSGSVAVECARLGAAAVAVDRDPAAIHTVQGNAAALRVAVQTVVGTAPQALAGLPDPDAVFVGGGGPAVVAAAAARAGRGIVVALAAVDRLAPTRDALAGGGWSVDGVQLQASRLAGLPDGGVRLAAANPVLLLWGVRR